MLSYGGQRTSPLQDGLGWKVGVWSWGVQTEGGVVRVFTVGTLKPRDGAHLCRILLVDGRETFTLEPRHRLIHAAWTWTVPVDHGPMGEGNFRSPRI